MISRALGHPVIIRESNIMDLIFSIRPVHGCWVVFYICSKNLIDHFVRK